MDSDDFGLRIDTSSPSTAPQQRGDVGEGLAARSVDKMNINIERAAAESKSKDFFSNLQPVGRVLGKGTTGVVELAVDAQTGNQYALKTINFDPSSRAQRKTVTREVEAITKNKLCPMLVQYFGVRASRSLGTVTLAMEYMDLGSLSDVVRATAPIPPVVLRVIAVRLLTGLKYLHEELRLIHRDVKPTNILLNSRGEVKLADFGLATEGTQRDTNTFAGTLTYLAPESFRSEGGSSEATDIWALGVTLCEVSLGIHPLQLAKLRRPQQQDPRQGSISGEIGNFWQTLEWVRAEDLGLPSYHPLFSEPMRHFIHSMLQKEPKLRGTCRNLLEHPWIQEVGNEIVVQGSDVAISGVTQKCFAEWLDVAVRQSR